MAHTNSTTHYSLPQFLTTDKPAWLTDINNAFSDLDTAVYNAQSKANTADTNASQALLDAADAASAASGADAKGSGAVASLADTFQTTETYAVGDLVIYNSLLYICTAAVSEPGAWTGSTNWSRTTLEGVINGLKATDIEYSTGVNVKQKIDNVCNYSETETLIGKWIDDRNVYQKVILINDTISNAWVDADTISGIARIVGAEFLVYEGGARGSGVRQGMFAEISTVEPGVVKIYNNTGHDVQVDYLILKYVKN